MSEIEAVQALQVVEKGLQVLIALLVVALLMLLIILVAYAVICAREMCKYYSLNNTTNYVELDF